VRSTSMRAHVAVGRGAAALAVGTKLCDDFRSVVAGGRASSGATAAGAPRRLVGFNARMAAAV
jgi:hypothetical protein